MLWVIVLFLELLLGFELCFCILPFDLNIPIIFSISIPTGIGLSTLLFFNYTIKQHNLQYSSKCILCFLISTISIISPFNVVLIIICPFHQKFNNHDIKPPFRAQKKHFYKLEVLKYFKSCALK